MDATISSLLQEVQAKEIRGTSFGTDGQTYTHETFYDPSSKWIIEKQKYTDFWKKYCDIVYKGKGNYGIGEKIEESMPILFECSLLFQDSGDTEFFDQDFYMQFTLACQDVMEELLDIPKGKKKEYYAIILGTDQVYSDPSHEKLMITFRIQFPYCKVDTKFQQTILRPKVIQLLRMRQVMSKLKEQPLNDWDSSKNPIIKPLIVSESVPLYQSVREPDMPKMTMRHLYTRLTKEDTETEDYVSELEPSDELDLRDHSDILSNVINEEVLEENDDDFEFWYPLLLSIRFCNKVTHVRSLSKAVAPPIINSSQRLVNTSSNDNDFDIASRLIEFIDKQKFENDTTWLDIGRSLYNACDGEKKGLELWIKYTVRSSVFREEDCRERYLEFDRQNYMSVRTIAWYAKQDKPTKYNEWHRLWRLSSLEKATSCLHTDVAKAFYRTYWIDFAYSGDNKWYIFKGHRWVESKRGILISKKISNEFSRSFEKLRTEISARVNDMTNDDDRNRGNEEIKRIMDLIKKLKTRNFKTNIFRESEEFFYIEGFETYLDSGENLIGHKNCVTEATDTKIFIRPGKPEDYITKTTKCSYPHHYSWDHPMVKKCMEHLNKVYPIKELVRHVLKLFGSILKGKNPDKLFPNLNGEGDNAKSIMVKFLQAVFGEYCVKVPTTFITTKPRSSGGPNPEIARAKSARLLIAEEPEDDDIFTVGAIKRISGGDSFFSRFLNDNGGEIDPLFKLFLVCNKIPDIKNITKAIKSRFRVIPHLGTFVDKPPKNENEQREKRLFQKDKFFEKQIPSMAPAFLWILVEYYAIYMKEGLTDPACVIEETDKYWKDHDEYQMFVDECLQFYSVLDKKGEKKELFNKNECITMKDIYEKFKFWYATCFPSKKDIPDQMKVEKALILKIGKMKGNRWYGYRILSDIDIDAKDHTEEEEENDKINEVEINKPIEFEENTNEGKMEV